MIEVGSQLEGYKNLDSIKGIGEGSAAILLSAIGDVNDFADESKLFDYFGIVPRVANLMKQSIEVVLLSEGLN